MFQAMAAWRWYNFIESQVPAGKSILRINLDETSLPLRPKSLRGHVFARNNEKLGERVSKHEQRACFTHVAMVCDDAEAQKLLPQYVVGNEMLLPARRMHELLACAPRNVVLVRQRSAWNNFELCCKIVQALGIALAPLASSRQPVLFMDACKIHTTRLVLDACRLAGIWVIIIPSRTTAKLQPLDTHVFASYKARLAAGYRRFRSESQDEKIEIKRFLDCVYKAMQDSFEAKCWDAAFSANGFGENQCKLSKSLRESLPSQAGEDTAPHRPAMQDLQLCFARRAAVPIDLLMWPFPMKQSGSNIAATASTQPEKERSAFTAPDC